MHISVSFLIFASILMLIVGFGLGVIVAVSGLDSARKEEEHYDSLKD